MRDFKEERLVRMENAISRLEQKVKELKGQLVKEKEE